MASLKAQRERDMRIRQPRLAGAAAQMTAHGQVTQDNTRVFQRARASGDAAVMPAHSAGQHETAPGRSPAGRVRSTSGAAASRSRSRTAADNVADTSGSSSGSSYAPSAADGAPEPGGAAGFGPHAGGARNLAVISAAGPPPGLVDGAQAIGGSVLPERAGPLLCALKNTEGHAASGALCLICTLARRWHDGAQPRRAARARGVVRRTSERRAPMQPPSRMRRGGLR
jgi:hypothetical protein